MALKKLVEVWDGTTWTETSALISSGGGHGSAASGRVGIGTLAGGAHKFGGGVFSTPASELFSAFENIWQPLLVGTLIIGIISSILGYFIMHMLWRFYAYNRLQRSKK